MVRYVWTKRAEVEVEGCVAGTRASFDVALLRVGYIKKA